MRKFTMVGFPTFEGTPACRAACYHKGRGAALLTAIDNGQIDRGLVQQLSNADDTAAVKGA
jgi:hypothetical protein